MGTEGDQGQTAVGGGPERPLVRLGWIVVAGIADPAQDELIQAVIRHVHHALQSQFPQYHWEMPLFRRPIYPPIGTTLDPLPLLELGAEEKLHRQLDLALVVVPNELTPRTRTFVTGVPSSALETAVISLARFMERADPAAGIAGLALHLLGHLLGAGHESQGVTEASADPDRIRVQDYSESTAGLIRERLDLVHYANFMATLGVMAGAFGGNLEDESEIKAVLLFDEET